MPDNWIGRRILTKEDTLHNGDGNKLHDLLPCDGSEYDETLYPVLSTKLTDPALGDGRRILGQVAALKSGTTRFYPEETTDPDWEEHYGSTYESREQYYIARTTGSAVHEEVTIPFADVFVGNVAMSYFQSANLDPATMYVTYKVAEVEVLKFKYTFGTPTYTEKLFVSLDQGATYTELYSYAGKAIVFLNLTSEGGETRWTLNRDNSGDTGVLPVDMLSFETVTNRLEYDKTSVYDAVVVFSQTYYEPSGILPVMVSPTGSPHDYKIIADAT